MSTFDHDAKKKKKCKHCGKRRICWLSAFSPFPAMFSILSKTTPTVLATLNPLQNEIF